MKAKVVSLFMVTVIMVLLGVLGVQYYLQMRTIQGLVAYSKVPKFVKVTQANAIQFSPSFITHGQIHAKQSIVVASQVGGELSKVMVKSGDSVKRGQRLLTLDDSVEQAEKLSVQIRLENAQKNFSRLENVYNSDRGISRENLDNARSSVSGLEAELKKINAMIDKKTLVASFDGVVDFTTLISGQVVQAGAPLLTLFTPDQLEAWIAIPQVKAQKIEKGQTFEFKSVATESTRGQVTELQNLVEQARLLARGEIDSSNVKGLMPGMSGQVRVFEGKEKQIRVLPQSAVILGISEQSVMVAEKEGDHHKAVTKVIKTGEMIDGWIEVVSGIDSQSLVISEGLSKISEGDIIDFDPLTKQKV